MSDHASYGRRTACLYCGHDVEWHGKRRRRDDGSVLTDHMTGGWTDRGGSSFCPGKRRLHRGNLS